MTLPADLAPGWYDVRLLSPDVNDNGIIKPIGRSEPIQVSAPTAATGAGTNGGHQYGSRGRFHSPYRASAPSKLSTPRRTFTAR
jgi:hypothetical protein